MPVNRLMVRFGPPALVVAFLTACGPDAHLASPVVDDAIEQADGSRATLQALRSHRFAEEVATELSRADTWLADVDRRIADGDQNEPITRLTLAAVRSQLSAIKSFYARREAERALDRAEGELDRRYDEADELEAELRQLESDRER